MLFGTKYAIWDKISCLGKKRLFKTKYAPWDKICYLEQNMLFGTKHAIWDKTSCQVFRAPSISGASSPFFWPSAL